MQKQTKSNIAAGLSRAKRCKRRFSAVKNSNAPVGDGGVGQIVPFCWEKRCPGLKKTGNLPVRKGELSGLHTHLQKNVEISTKL